MLHAVRNKQSILEVKDDEVGDVFMYIGPSRPGHPTLEVGVIEWYDMFVIIHAMEAREKYGGVTRR